MIFTDRREAGEQLAKALSPLTGSDAVVLAIPRGGVVVGRVVADRLGVPLEVDTVAVKVTGSVGADGFIEETSAVVVAVWLTT